MPEPIRGIHHITAIAADPQRNLDFYTQVLGLRLVKLTVNFDDPGAYHFYFGDAQGHPGTILTFFPWGSSVRRGQHGTGQVGVTAFQIPQNAAGYWVDRLKKQGITVSSPFTRFDEEVLTLLDPDGLALELVASAQAPTAVSTWDGSQVPTDYAIRGFGPASLLVQKAEGTMQLLSTVFGLNQVQESTGRYRFMAENTPGGWVDIEERPAEPRGRMGSGVVHHIAWRARDEAQQLEWREQLVLRGFEVTPVLDRQYFRSIYFREPGGILFEIATDPPGFTFDETFETLGTQLRLPPWYEEQREAIQQALPELRLPQRETGR